MRDDPLYRPLPDSFDPPPPAPVAPPVPRARTYSWCLATSTFLSLAAAAGALWFVVPKFAEVYEQVKIPMPAATLSIVALSRWACDYPWLVVAFIGGFPAWAGSWKGTAKTLGKILLPLGASVLLAAIGLGTLHPLVFS